MSTIPGTNVSAAIRPQDTADTFATHLAAEGQGGYYPVADTAARDAITPERRSVGQRVHVVSTGLDWRLVGGIANSNWTLIQNAASGQPSIDGTLPNTTPVVIDLTGLTLNRNIYLMPGAGCTVKLEYSTDGGTTWNVVISTTTTVPAYIYASAGDVPNRLRLTATTAPVASTYHLDGDANSFQPALGGTLTSGTPVLLDISNFSLPRTVRLLPKSGDTVTLDVSYDGGGTWVGAEQVVATSDIAIYVYASAAGSRPTTLRFTRSAGTSATSQWAVSAGQI